MLLFNFFSLYDDLGVFMVEISVVIPAYNAVAYLDEAINSIINQSQFINVSKFATKSARKIRIIKNISAII